MPQKDAWRLQAQKPAAAALQAKFREATAAHQQGKFADAERIYGDILRQQPNHFDALHRLGVIAAQTGRTERAVELFRRAIKLNATVAAAHRNLGIALAGTETSQRRARELTTGRSRSSQIMQSVTIAAVLHCRTLKRPAEALVAYRQGDRAQARFC